MDDTQKPWTVAGGMLLMLALLFIATRILKFRFVLGVGD